MRVRLLFTLLALIPTCAACGGSKVDMSIPPLTPEPTITLPPDAPLDPVETKASFPARLALDNYLRGLAKGNPRACAYLAPAYDRATFGKAGCRAWVPQIKRQVPAADLAALRSVVVPTATPGPGAAEYTVRFADLQWRTDPAKPSAILPARFVLRHISGQWKIVA